MVGETRGQVAAPRRSRAGCTREEWDPVISCGLLLRAEVGLADL